MREGSKENARPGALRRHPALALRGLIKLIGGWLVLCTVRPVRDAWRTLRGRHPVRVFTFHRITDTVAPTTVTAW